MRLWELEEGDEGQGQAEFAGARRAEAEAIRLAEEADREEAQRLQEEENVAAAADNNQGFAEPEDVPDLDDVQGEDFVLFPRGERARDEAAPAPRVLVADVNNGPPLDAVMAQLNIQRPAAAAAAARQPRLPLVANDGPQNPRQAAGRNHGAARGRGGQQQQRGREQQGGNRGRGPPPAAIDERFQAQAQLGADQAAILRRFVEMAERDEEDGWDSDELEDDEMWEIRAR